MTWPNIISLTRLLSVPFNVWLIMVDQWRLALVVFCLAGLSDAVDGFLAKRFAMESRLGQYLDPIADKVLLTSIFIVLGAQQQLPSWLVILVVSRDIMIVGGLLLLYVFDQPSEVKPFMLSKINTVVQIILAASVLASLAFTLEHISLHLQVSIRMFIQVFIQMLILAVTLSTIASGMEYLVDWWRRMNKLEQN